MTEPSPSDYFVEIEAHFAAKRGTPFILSPKDFALMKKWADDGVPLPVVIEAIDTVFERNETSGRRKVISSLSYCRHAVKELWSERKELYVGGREVSPEAGIEEPLAMLAESLLAAEGPPELLAEMADAVRGLASEKSVPRVEERLIELEQTLIERLVASLPPDESTAMQAEIARALGDPTRIDEKTRKRTEEANLRRIVRERFGLPRLSLFG